MTIKKELSRQKKNSYYCSSFFSKKKKADFLIWDSAFMFNTKPLYE